MGESESKGNCNYSNFALLCRSNKSKIAMWHWSRDESSRILELKVAPC